MDEVREMMTVEQFYDRMVKLTNQRNRGLLTDVEYRMETLYLLTQTTPPEGATQTLKG